jgi:hypothetical protein
MDPTTIETLTANLDQFFLVIMAEHQHQLNNDRFVLNWNQKKISMKVTSPQYL